MEKQPHERDDHGQVRRELDVQLRDGQAKLTVGVSSVSRRDRIEKSKQFRGGRFHNTSGLGPELKGTEFGLMRDLLFGGRKRRPKISIPVDNPVAVWSSAPASGLRVTWMGHSTLMIEIGGARILTDPVFGDY